MQIFTSLKLGSFKPFALAIMVLASSVFTAFTWPSLVPEANAVGTECYAYNNRQNPGTDKISLLDPVNVKKTDCINAGYCIKGGSASVPMSCSDEVYKASDQYKAIQDAADREAVLNTQVSPVVTVICGQPSTNTQADAEYADCYAKTKAQYPTCQNAAEEGSPTDDEINSAIASCMNAWAKKTYPSKKIDLDKLTAAVAKGRGDGQAEAGEQGAIKDKQTCEATEGNVWADGKCIEKPVVLCSGGPLGWIMCPIAELATSVTQFFAGLINSFLTFSPLLTSTQGKAIQGVWQLIVNIANILLVIAFLMVVFSQATSVGLSNYGIKKMLPKIIAAAILMNLSFFICAIAIDISNILGQSVAGIMQVGIDQVDKSAPIVAGSPLADLKQGSDGGDIAFVSLLGALGIGGLIIAPGLLYFILPILLSAAAAMFTALGVIIFRQVALVIMIILSPLAFVAWILPNTESWFEKWRKFFIALLAMFPLIMGIFYGATFLSHIMLLTLDPSKPTEMNIVKIMALAVLVLPLFALPFVMKAAGGILERFGALVNDRQKGLIDRSRNWAKDNSKRTNASQRARMAQARWGYEKDAQGKVVMKDGKAVTKEGFKARAARGLSRSTNFVGGFSDRQNYKHAQQEDNSKRIQNEQIYERLAEVDSEGNPTRRAEGYATAAAGAGGAKNAERIRRLAMEQRKTEVMNDVKRENSANISAGAYDSGAYYYEYDKDGNLKIDKKTGKAVEYSDHGRAMTALARGDSIGVIKAGQEKSEANAKKNILKGDTMEKQYAAMMRSTSIGDGAALSYMMYGDENAGIEALKDSQFSDFSQFVGDNAGGIGPKLSHLITNDQGITGITGEKMASLHGAEFKAAGSRIRQLREKATEADSTGHPGEATKLRKSAQTMQDAYENAYKTLVTDSQLKEKLTIKQVTAMQDFNDIVSGVNTNINMDDGTLTVDTSKPDKDRAVLREYQESIEKTGGGRSVVTSKDGVVSRDKLGVKDLFMGNAAQFLKSNKPAAPQAINLQTTSPGGAPVSSSATDVATQVSVAGGWASLTPDDVMNTYNHAGSLPRDRDSDQLRTDALTELRNRGILPPGPGTP